MNLEQQVCSLDLAQRLKELGVKEASYFVWCNHESPSAKPCDWHLEPALFDCEVSTEGVSAFTVAELLQMLKEPVLVPVDGSAADYLAGLIIKQHEDGNKH